MTTSTRTYETMNGLRGAAALAVAVFHMFSFFWPQKAASGYLAVDFFFALSGFVVAGAYQAKLVSGTLTMRGFAAKRLIRFYPLYLLGLVLGIAQVVAENVLHMGGAIPIGSIGWALVPALFFLPAFGPGIFYIAPLNGPAWSLIFEFWVNVAWAAIARLTSLRGYIALLVVAGIAFVWGAIWANDIGLGTTWPTVPGGIARTVFSFTAGLLIYRYRSGAHGRQTIWSVALLAILLILLFADPPRALRLPYDLVFALALSPLIVLMASTMEPPPACRRLFALLGELSFPLYAIHMPVIAAGIVVTRHLQMPPVTAGIAVLIGAAIAAWIVDKIDIRVRNAIESKRSRRGAGA